MRLDLDRETDNCFGRFLVMDEDEKKLEIYKQRCEHFRSLNEIMWRIPVMVMTITGGLLFGVAKFEMSDFSKAALLIFAALINIIFSNVLWRLRDVMDIILLKINHYEGEQHKRGFVVVKWFIAGMVVSAVACLGAAFYVKEVFKDNNSKIRREMMYLEHARVDDAYHRASK